MIAPPFPSRAARPDDAVRGVGPEWVIEPSTESEAASALAWADAAGLKVAPRGGGTKIEWGNPPRRADVVLSTAGLNRVVEHAAADLTVTVEAGCTMGDLQQTLAAQGQRVAVDSLWPARATVGGVLSTNDTGALRLRFGGLRDLIIGATIVLADGTIAHSGGKVVKNVAGYDLPKLVTGALGTLGVITTAVFRLHPLPEEARTCSAPVADAAAVERSLRALQESPLAHTAIQVRAVSGGPLVVDVLIEGSSAGVAERVGRTRPLIESSAFEAAAPASIWSAREALWAGGAGPIVKVSVLPRDIGATIESAMRRAEARALACSAVAYATGLLWLRVDGDAEGTAGVVAALRGDIERGGGSLVVARPAGLPESFDAWGTPGDAQALMAAVKRQFDPRSTLNPGRFVGGL